MSPLGHSNAIQFWNSWVLLWNTSPTLLFHFKRQLAEACRELNYQQRTKENSTVATFANIFTSLLTIIFCQKLFWFSSNGRYLQIFSYIWQLFSCQKFFGFPLMGDICKYFHISDNYFPVKSFLVFPWESGRVVTTNQVWASPGAAIQCWEIFKILVIRAQLWKKWKWQPWSLRRKFGQPRLEKSLEKCLKTLLFPCIWGVSEIILLLSVKPFPH